MLGSPDVLLSVLSNFAYHLFGSFYQNGRNCLGKLEWMQCLSESSARIDHRSLGVLEEDEAHLKLEMDAWK